MPVGAVQAGGQGPSCIQDGRAAEETSAAEPVADDPDGHAARSAWQLIAVTSEEAEGTVAAVQVVPPSGSVDDGPLAVGCLGDLADRSAVVTVAARDSRQVAHCGGNGLDRPGRPPSTVATTAAPFGASAVPRVEPAAQHRNGLTQSTPVSEFTGAGRVAEVSVPTQGEPGAMVDGTAEPVFEPLEEQDDTASATRAIDTDAAVRDWRRRPIDGVGCVGRGEGGVFTEVGEAVSGIGRSRWVPPGRRGSAGPRSPLTSNPGRFPGGAAIRPTMVVSRQMSSERRNSMAFLRPIEA